MSKAHKKLNVRCWISAFAPIKMYYVFTHVAFVYVVFCLDIHNRKNQDGANIFSQHYIQYALYIPVEELYKKNMYLL